MIFAPIFIKLWKSDSSRISMKLNFCKIFAWLTGRVKNKRSPWITNVLLREIYKREFLKKKAASTNDPLIWKQFKDARNKANNSVKKAKRKYFSENLDANKSDPRKTWRLINELQSRQSKSTKVSQVKTGNQVFTSPGDIAEAFENKFYKHRPISRTGNS